MTGRLVVRAVSMRLTAMRRSTHFAYSCFVIRAYSFTLSGLSQRPMACMRASVASHMRSADASHTRHECGLRSLARSLPTAASSAAMM